MTIDKAENYLIALKHCETCEANDTNICKACDYYRRGSSAKCYDAIDAAIETMHKYRKIEEILDQLIDFKIRTYDAVIEIEDIVYGQAGDQNEES